MKKHKFAFSSLFVMLLASTMLLTGCGSGGGGSSSTSNTQSASTPAKSITEFSSSLLTKADSKVLDNVSLDSQQRVQTFLDQLDDDSRNRMAAAMSNATVISETANRVVFKTTILNPDNTTSDTTFELIKEDGVWRLKL